MKMVHLKVQTMFLLGKRDRLIINEGNEATKIGMNNFQKLRNIFFEVKPSSKDGSISRISSNLHGENFCFHDLKIRHFSLCMSRSILQKPHQNMGRFLFRTPHKIGGFPRSKFILRKLKMMAFLGQ